MKKFTVGIIVVLCLLISGCFDIQFGNSIKGYWTLIGYIDHIHNEDTTYTRGEIYNPDIDQYNIATIVGIIDNKMIVYNDDYDAEYYADTMYTVSFTEDSLYISDYGCVDTMLTIAYYFNDNKHLIWVVEADENYTNEMHFKKYTGQVPPDSWIMELSGDEYEPNDDIENATSIRLNIRQSHTLTENDSDYYKIQAKTGKSYLIQGLAYFPMEMYLFDQEGDSLAYDYSNDLGISDLGDEVRSVILWTCDVTDNYYPAIIPRYHWSSRGYYQMLVTEVDTNDIEFGEPEGWYYGTGYNKGIDIFKIMMNK